MARKGASKREHVSLVEPVHHLAMAIYRHSRNRDHGEDRHWDRPDPGLVCLACARNADNIAARQPSSGWMLVKSLQQK